MNIENVRHGFDILLDNEAFRAARAVCPPGEVVEHARWRAKDLAPDGDNPGHEMTYDGVMVVPGEAFGTRAERGAAAAKKLREDITAAVTRDLGGKLLRGAEAWEVDPRVEWPITTVTIGEYPFRLIIAVRPLVRVTTPAAGA